MKKSEEEEEVTRRPAPPAGWEVFTRPEREPEPADDEIKSLLRDINVRRRDSATPEEPGDAPEAA